MIGRVRESRNPKKVIRVSLMESYGEIGRVPVKFFLLLHLQCKFKSKKQEEALCLLPQAVKKALSNNNRARRRARRAREDICGGKPRFQSSILTLQFLRPEI